MWYYLQTNLRNKKGNLGRLQITDFSNISEEITNPCMYTKIFRRFLVLSVKKFNVERKL